MNIINKNDIKELKDLKFEKLYYIGNKELLKRPKISIVGSRKALNYSKEFAFKIAREFAKRGYVVVSGAAMGIDAAAHRGAGSENTIAVVANGLDIKYPAVNRELIIDIEKNGLVLSQFDYGFKQTPWSFVIRNEIVVALGEILIVCEAEVNSGSMRSVEYALRMNKNIYVLPHRLNSSSGTNYLLKKSLAKPIYDIEEFANSFKNIEEKKDDFIEYLKTSPLYEDAVKKYKEKIFEAEILGEIEIVNMRIIYKG
ncbi:DNA-processing protein DprA [Nitrosophilus kaiyonis]|uniref:DNA-processing protein DprA n=1 Tax=Nitrosophilus kaiyonis TaxID=2930200 RepID=UPI002491183B|nr:DNA-processing protein DprA [Nitrosophilus kaiyonis]